MTSLQLKAFQKTSRKSDMESDHTIYLHNFVNKDLEKFFKPFNIIQVFLMTPRYGIKDGFIFPNGWIAHIASFSSAFLNIAGKIVQAAAPGDTLKNRYERGALYATLLLGNSIQTIGYIVNFFSVFNKRHKIVSLMLKIQKISNVLDFNSKRFKRNVTFNNRLNLVLFFIYMLFNLTVFAVAIQKSRMALLGDLLQLPFFMNILYSIRMIVILQSYAMSLVENMKNQNTGVKSGEMHCLRISNAFGDLLKCHLLFIDVFQDYILYFVAETFGNTLTYVESTIALLLLNLESHPSESAEDYSTATSVMVIIIFWMVRNLVLIHILGAEMEKFYLVLDEIYAQSCVFADTPCEEVERRMLKNIRREYRARFSKATARGVFFVDATLPLKLVTLITSYIVVILQFNFTK